MFGDIEPYGCEVFVLYKVCYFCGRPHVIVRCIVRALQEVV